MKTASTVSRSQIKIKQKPILAVGNRGQTIERYNRDRFKRRPSEVRTTSKYNNDTEKKPCNRRGKSFKEGHLKNCPAMGIKCKNCNKPNHFARMCRSQQVNEITETTESSEEECNLIQTFDSCDEFEVMSIESKSNQMKSINSYTQRRLVNKQNCKKNFN